jgi:hypothetical protein
MANRIGWVQQYIGVLNTDSMFLHAQSIYWHFSVKNYQFSFILFHFNKSNRIDPPVNILILQVSKCITQSKKICVICLYKLNMYSYKLNKYDFGDNNIILVKYKGNNTTMSEQYNFKDPPPRGIPGV